MRVAIDHLESAKCIRGLSATPRRIPPKLYHLILPYPFKPPQIISRKTPRGRSMTHNVVRTSAKDTGSSICNACRGGRNLSETRRISRWRPCDLRMSSVNFHPRNPSYRFHRALARFSTPEKRASPSSWQELRDRRPERGEKSRKLSIVTAINKSALRRFRIIISKDILSRKTCTSKNSGCIYVYICIIIWENSQYLQKFKFLF